MHFRNVVPRHVRYGGIRFAVKGAKHKLRVLPHHLVTLSRAILNCPPDRTSNSLLVPDHLALLIAEIVEGYLVFFRGLKAEVGLVKAKGNVLKVLLKGGDFRLQPVVPS